MNASFYPAKRVIIFSLIFFTHLSASADTAVLQRGYTPDVAGANLNETVLTPANVNPASFGRIFSLPVDAAIYAQPLYVPNLSIGGAPHNVVFVATMKDSLYAFDADQPNAPLWAVNYAAAIPGAIPVPVPFFQGVGTNSGNISGPVGIESTPVIDAVTNTMYFVTNTYEIDQFVFRLHAVDITSGAEKFGGPTVINGTFTGSGNTLNFDPSVHNQRTSLTLANGQVIVAFASHNDFGQYYGWIMSYGASTLTMTGIFNGAPSNHGAAVWQCGRPPAVDSAGYVYLYTGNGFPDTKLPTADGINNFAESALKLDPKSLKVLDYFTPESYQDMDAQDADLSSSGPSLMPGTNVLIGGGKTGIMYLLNTQNLGQNQTNDTGALQNPTVSYQAEIRGGPVIWSRSAPAGGALVYNWSAGDSLKAFSYNSNTSTISTYPVSTFSGQPLLYPGGMLALSANGDNNGIIWAAINSQGDADTRVAPGELVALNAANLSQELWASTNVPARDDFGLWSKYVPPLVVNGKVFMATQSNQLVVYGLLPTQGAAVVSAWPPQQAALGRVANYIVAALTASGSPTPANWTVTGLPVGAAGNFITDAQGRTVLQVQLGLTTPRGSYRLFATANVNGYLTTQAVLLNVPDASATPIAKATADSQVSPHLAKAAIDGNSNTFWKTLDTAPAPNYPHSITLDLGSVKPVSGVSYLPRQDGCVDGTVMQYEVSLNADGVNWFSQSAGGSFDYGPAWRTFACNQNSFPQIQTISFPVTNARYIMLNVLGSVIDGDPWASAAEVKVYVANGAAPLAGDYTLVARHSGKAMDGLTLAPGAPVTQESYAVEADQQWRIAASPNPGYYSLTNLASIATGNTLVLDVTGNSGAPGALLELWYPWGGYNQQFKFNPSGDGTGFYTMTNFNTGQCNDVLNISTADGAAIGQWPCANGSYNFNEQWWLTPADPSLP